MPVLGQNTRSFEIIAEGDEVPLKTGTAMEIILYLEHRYRKLIISLCTVYKIKVGESRKTKAMHEGKILFVKCTK